MDKDEAAIRELIDTWMAATRAGDTETVLGLMAEDAVFLVRGQAPFGKREFAKAAKRQKASSMKFEGGSEIREIRIVDDWAFTVAELTVRAKTGDAAADTRSGHAMTLFQKRDGKWLLARDANLLS